MTYSLTRLHGQQGNEPDQGADFQRQSLAIGYTQLVVEKAVLVVPESLFR